MCFKYFWGKISKGWCRQLSPVQGLWVNNYAASCSFQFWHLRRGRQERHYNVLITEEEVSCHRLRGLWGRTVGISAPGSQGSRIWHMLPGFISLYFQANISLTLIEKLMNRTCLCIHFLCECSVPLLFKKPYGLPFIAGMANISLYQSQHAWRCPLQIPLPPKLSEMQKDILFLQDLFLKERSVCQRCCTGVVGLQYIKHFLKELCLQELF